MRIFIYSLLIVLCFLDTLGKTCELPIEAREILRAYQRGILKKVEEARKKPIEQEILEFLEKDSRSYTSPYFLSVAFSVREATELTLARTPPDADLKVLLVDLDDTLFFQGMGRFLDTKFLINKAIVQKIVNQQGFQTFEAFAINARNVFKTPSLSENSDTSNRVVVSPHTNHFKNPLFYNTRETMEDGICEQLKRLHDEGGYQIIGLTSRSPAAVMQDYTHACLKDAKISFHNLHCFASTVIEFQSDNDGFTFSNGIIFCGPRDKARQASLFLAHNLHLKYIKPVESLHLVCWDDQRKVIKRAMKDGNYTGCGIAKKVSKHGICMGLEPLLEKSLESKDWEPKAAAALFLNLLLQNPEIRASSTTK